MLFTNVKQCKFHHHFTNLFHHKFTPSFHLVFSCASFSSLISCSHQGLCLEIEQTQQASDSAEHERWRQLSSKAREELSTLQCILGSMKDNQVVLFSCVENLEAFKCKIWMLYFECFLHYGLNRCVWWKWNVGWTLFRRCCLVMHRDWATKRIYRKSLTIARLEDSTKN